MTETPPFISDERTLGIIARRSSGVLLYAAIGGVPPVPAEIIEAMASLHIDVIVTTASSLARATGLPAGNDDAVFLSGEGPHLIKKTGLPPKYADSVSWAFHLAFNQADRQADRLLHAKAVSEVIRRLLASPQVEPIASDEPFALFGLTPAATERELTKAKHRLAALCHPDKVAHLAPLLQQIALEETTKINVAYEAALAVLRRRQRAAC